ncbi:hypothetical protein ILUMI_23309 [Ignelater luminosus]|uniref:Uncharacterized protein n=1 Tax=Ignelater luminosus TaxID=2038154 RepID=A0A8K0CCK6_IGNLU|nr:hypothetical protein ILUMI_23309 [Ignelater luminosus]
MEKTSKMFAEIMQQMTAVNKKLNRMQESLDKVLLENHEIKEIVNNQEILIKMLEETGKQREMSNIQENELNLTEELIKTTKKANISHEKHNSSNDTWLKENKNTIMSPKMPPVHIEAENLEPTNLAKKKKRKKCISVTYSKDEFNHSNTDTLHKYKSASKLLANDMYTNFTENISKRLSLPNLNVDVSYADSIKTCTSSSGSKCNSTLNERKLKITKVPGQQILRNDAKIQEFSNVNSPPDYKDMQNWPSLQNCKRNNKKLTSTDLTNKSNRNLSCSPKQKHSKIPPLHNSKDILTDTQHYNDIDKYLQSNLSFANEESNYNLQSFENVEQNDSTKVTSFTTSVKLEGGTSNNCTACETTKPAIDVRNDTNDFFGYDDTNEDILPSDDDLQQSNADDFQLVINKRTRQRLNSQSSNISFTSDDLDEELFALLEALKNYIFISKKSSNSNDNDDSTQKILHVRRPHSRHKFFKYRVCK